jgi:hypothetical protein
VHPCTAVAAAAIIVVIRSAPTAAQMPGVPVLQNAWANPGATAALDFGSTSGINAYALAAAWAPKSARFQLSGGLGLLDVDAIDSASDGKTRWTGFGTRLAIPIRSFANGVVGVAAFGGIGGARHDSLSIVHVPIGLGIGARRAFGDVRGVSAYVTPFFVWTRESISGAGADRTTAFQASVGVDAALARSIGVTLGLQFGAKTSDIVGGSGTIFGAGLSYAFR